MIILMILIRTRVTPEVINWSAKDDPHFQAPAKIGADTARDIVDSAVKLAEEEATVNQESALAVTEEKEISFLGILPALSLIVIVLGSMYTGLAQPIEAAGYGVIGAFLILVCQRRMTRKIFGDALTNTARTGTMMIFLMTCGFTMTFVISYLGISQTIAAAIVTSGMGKYTVLALVYVLWFILGCLMDPASMLILTIPFLFKTLMDFGFDRLWLGVVSVLAAQIAMITPPVGMNLFVLRANTNLPMGSIIKGSIPYVLLMLSGLLILTVFPQIALYLPSIMF
ncbi:MAG: TRAP transporter large permease subunit, partial [Peptococcaceae bacterium]|jgi:tripartite ATP-independent transporter DctM subunit|nr:TRAP transporter large permease subunit [Peptococcaceae bacterium]